MPRRGGLDARGAAHVLGRERRGAEVPRSRAAVSPSRETSPRRSPGDSSRARSSPRARSGHRRRSRSSSSRLPWRWSTTSGRRRASRTSRSPIVRSRPTATRTRSPTWTMRSRSPAVAGRGRASGGRSPSRRTRCTCSAAGTRCSSWPPRSPRTGCATRVTLSLLTSLLEIRLHRGELDEARRLRSLYGDLEQAGDVQDRSIGLSSLALLRRAEGELEEALRLGIEAIEVARAELRAGVPGGQAGDGRGGRGGDRARPGRRGRPAPPRGRGDVARGRLALPLRAGATAARPSGRRAGGRRGAVRVGRRRPTRRARAVLGRRDRARARRVAGAVRAVRQRRIRSPAPHPRPSSGWPPRRGSSAQAVCRRRPAPRRSPETGRGASPAD